MGEDGEVSQKLMGEEEEEGGRGRRTGQTRFCFLLFLRKSFVKLSTAPASKRKRRRRKKKGGPPDLSPSHKRRMQKSGEGGTKSFNK